MSLCVCVFYLFVYFIFIFFGGGGGGDRVFTILLSELLAANYISSNIVFFKTLSELVKKLSKTGLLNIGLYLMS